jgi:CobQ-like glutamine amidotransferase family enzyme
VESGAVVLAVCAGYQVIGQSFPGADGRPHPGVGLLDVVTVKGPGRRAVGELAAAPIPHATVTGAADPVVLETLTGFENHSAVTRVGAGARPLARVLTGVGNGGGDDTEGARSGLVLGTYAHGPALARNPSLADLLLAWATGTVPVPLEDVEERALRAQRLAAVGARGWRHGPTGRTDAMRRLRDLVMVRRS